MKTSTYTNLLDVLTVGRELPEGMEWGIRSVHPDLRSSRDFRWPSKGWAVCSLPAYWLTRDSPCPSREGDGLCTARTWAGMASGSTSAQTLLLTQHYTVDVLGETPDKIRASRIKVVEVIDGLRLLREHGRGADLHNANLRGANLHGAQLHGVDLHLADLTFTNLSAADLPSANLYGANLTRANMHAVGLHGAYLYGADLSGADLTGADLTGADLTWAHLVEATLVDADLRYANLSGVNMKAADLTGAKLGTT